MSVVESVIVGVLKVGLDVGVDVNPAENSAEHAEGTSGMSKETPVSVGAAPSVDVGTAVSTGSLAPTSVGVSVTDVSVDVGNDRSVVVSVADGKEESVADATAESVSLPNESVGLEESVPFVERLVTVGRLEDEVEDATSVAFAVDETSVEEAIVV